MRVGSKNSFIEILPDELIIQIFSLLDPVSLSVVSLVCRRIGGFSNDDRLWVKELSKRKIKVIAGRSKFQLVEHLRNYCSFCINHIKTPKPFNEKNVFSYWLQIKSSRQSCKIDLKSIFNDLSKILERSDNTKVDLGVQGFIREEEDRLDFSFLHVEKSITYSLSDETVSLLLSKVDEPPCERPLSHPLEFERSDRILKEWINKSKVNMADLEIALKKGRSEEIIAYLAQKVSEKGDLISNNVVSNACKGEYSDQFVAKLIYKISFIDGMTLRLAIENHRSDDIIEKMISKLNRREFQSNRTLAKDIVSLAQSKGYPRKIINMLKSKN